MIPLIPGSAESRIQYEDHSGVDIAAYANPYDALIEACENDPGIIQARYSTHRTARNAQQKAKLLSPDFSGLILDPLLQKLEDPTIEPGFTDPRHCLVFWARPPAHIQSLVDNIQQELLKLAPRLWLMPPERLHLTALEITHSLTQGQINAIITSLGTSTVETMTDYTHDPFHRARLIKPMLSYDGAAIALSFLPAAGESLSSPPPASDPSPLALPGDPKEERKDRRKGDDKFTYHHLRRSLFALARATGVSIDSRYVVPSSHITIGRFLTQEDHDSPAKMQAWISKIEDVNGWLEREFWPKDGDATGEERKKEGEWLVGQESGLDFREGRLWYGGGNTVRIGRGF